MYFPRNTATEKDMDHETWGGTAHLPAVWGGIERDRDDGKEETQQLLCDGVIKDRGHVFRTATWVAAHKRGNFFNEHLPHIISNRDRGLRAVRLDRKRSARVLLIVHRQISKPVKCQFEKKTPPFVRNNNYYRLGSLALAAPLVFSVKNSMSNK
jgi:hypothetical protein